MFTRERLMDCFRYTPRKLEQEESEDIPMKNGMSNTNFKSDSDF